MKQLKLYFDGSCNMFKKPTIASYGFIIEENGQIVNSCSETIGFGDQMTNNLAEFEALYQGLSNIQKTGLLDDPKSTLVSVYGDSALVINIMNKKWRAKSFQRYYPAYQRCVEIVKELRNSGLTITFSWISRNYNKIADKLSRNG